MEAVYRELRKIAAGHIRREHAARSFQTTDLVHDAHPRLVAIDMAQANAGDLFLLEEALTRLEKVDRRQCQVVEMRFFAGMQEEEMAEVLGVSARTINREWRMARAWLYKELYGESGPVAAR
jgi:DNA-directed RNA polymerase specialized sigma24 family protein